MRAKTWLCLAMLLFGASVANAQDYIENEFTEGAGNVGQPQNAVDGYEPFLRNQFADPLLGGVPPVDFNDIRNGWVGVIEENMSPVGDVLYPGPDPGANTPEFGVITPEAGNGPYWSPSSFDIDCPILCFNVDNYADPVLVANNNGVPDWWWTNAVTNDGVNYLTESGITGTVDPTNVSWTYATTSGVPIASVPVGGWYELEVCFQPGGNGSLEAVHSVWDSTHTVLLGSVTLNPLFLSPTNQTVGPYYSWFTLQEANVDALFIDDFKVECVPEPSSLALAGFGVVGLAFAARRRRTA